MRCESECFPRGSRCGWDCYAMPTEARENGIRLNEVDKDGYLLLSEGKRNIGQKKNGIA